MISRLLNDCGTGGLSLWRLTRRCAGGRDQSKLLDLSALRRPQQLPDGLLVDTQPMRDRPVAQPLALEYLEATLPLPGNAPSTATRTLSLSQRCHPPLRATLLVLAH